MGTLTVKENISFSAKLRMAPGLSDEERDELVNDVVEELGLTHVADSKVNSILYYKVGFHCEHIYF